MLELKNISKSYVTGEFKQTALKKVDLKFRKNEFVAILGHSGSGKTTLLNIIGGLDRYDSGDLIINGKSTKKFKQKEWDAYRNNCIGFVFQNYNLINHISILDNIEMSMTLSGVSARKRKKKAMQALEKVGLKEHAHKRPNQLSGGQMQRVAIARALANDPDIILADEPTGALDSATSIQIMDLIKEIAQDKLVIMVTHNSELAYSYANRIVTIKDGEVVDDTNSLENADVDDVYSIKKTSMSFLTALKLSFNNIITKMGRTLITAFASSIGIIGIALILSLSNGFDIQIDKFETETLSNMPIMISSETIELDEEAMISIQEQTKNNEHAFTDEKFIFPKESIVNNMVHENNISKEYVEYIQNLDKNAVAGLSFVRVTGMNILNKVNGKVNLLQVGATSIGNGGAFFNPIPKKLNNETDGVYEKNFDLLEGRFPLDETELVLIVDKNNGVNEKLVEMMNLDKNSERVSFDDVLNTRFKVVFNDDLYQNMGSFFMPNLDFASLYESPNALELKVVGIIRAKEENKVFQSTMGLGYNESLVDLVIEKNKDSKIVVAQKNADYNVMNGEKIDMNTKEGMQTYGTLLAYLGADTVPFMINIYPNDFDSKEIITSYLDDYNNKEIEKVKYIAEDYINIIKGKITDENDPLLKTVDQTLLEKVPDAVDLTYEDKELNGAIKVGDCEFTIHNGVIEKSSGGVTYTDLADTMVQLSGSIMDAITIVLISFSAISLIVSSIMIGIITYISVLERTKEIGVLRAIGASKRNISSIFNAETFIIGLLSGLLGVGVTFASIPPINALIHNVTDNYDIICTESLTTKKMIMKKQLSIWPSMGCMLVDLLLAILSKSITFNSSLGPNQIF